MINTAGASAALYKLFRFAKPLERVFDKWTLQACGIREAKHVVFHAAANTNDATRARYLAQARRLGNEFFSK